MRKKCEEYERTFWEVENKTAAGEGSAALWQQLRDFKFD
jgi:hypothetical protein